MIDKHDLDGFKTELRGKYNTPEKFAADALINYDSLLNFALEQSDSFKTFLQKYSVENKEAIATLYADAFLIGLYIGSHIEGVSEPSQGA
jgi:hypothetical protein